MKTLIFLLIGMVVAPMLDGQVITVTFKELYTFKHPKDMDLYQAQRDSVLEFTAFGAVNGVDVVDLNNNTYTRITNGIVDYSGTISENIKDGNVFTIWLGKSLFILSHNIENGEYVFIAEHPDTQNTGFIRGELSMGNQLEVKIEQ